MTSPNPPANRMAAFGIRNFRVYFVGQVLSTLGTWLQIFAQAWLVLELTDRKSAVPLTIAVSTLPLLLFGSHAGVLADRFDNRKLLLITSVLLGALAVVLGVLSQSGHANVWNVNVLAFLAGTVGALERPVSSSILFELVGREQLSGAVAINGTIMSLGRLVSPAIGGLIIDRWSVTPCFFINAASYLLVIVALMMLRRREMIERPRIPRTPGAMRKAVAYVRSVPGVGRPLLLMAFVGTLAFNFPAVTPPMFKFVLNGSERAMGITQSISGVGSVIAGYALAGRKFSEKSIALASIAFGVALAAAGSAPNVVVWGFFGFAVGFTASSLQAVNQTVLQRKTSKLRCKAG